MILLKLNVHISETERASLPVSRRGLPGVRASLFAPGRPMHRGDRAGPHYDGGDGTALRSIHVITSRLKYYNFASPQARH